MRLGYGLLVFVSLVACSRSPYGPDSSVTPERPSGPWDDGPRPSAGARPMNVCESSTSSSLTLDQTTDQWPQTGRYQLQVINAESMSHETATHLCEDARTINGFALARFSKTPRYWKDVFGDADSGLERYMTDRVRYFDESQTSGQVSNRGEVIATNVGTGYFLNYLQTFNKAEKTQFVVNGVQQWLSFDDPRVGYITIFPGFNSKRSYNRRNRSSQNGNPEEMNSSDANSTDSNRSDSSHSDPSLSDSSDGSSNGRSISVSRLVTLVHEGRHSDCTGGLPQSLLNRYQNSRNTQDLVASQCGHLHVKCSAGHDLAGVEACDRRIWDAYGIGAMVAKIFSYCTTCSELERQTARYELTDSLSRIDGNELDRFNNGQAPSPDMTSDVRVMSGH